MKKCSICRKEATPGSSINHDECRHWSHTECLDSLLGDDIDFDYCPKCTGNVTSAEPTPEDGNDYIVNPILVDTSGIGIELLNKKTPIEKIIAEHDLGLQHLIGQGVVIDDFLSNGYTMDDLLKFNDMKSRPQQALYTLGLTPDHILMYADTLLEPSKLKDTFGITPADICSLYGLSYNGDHLVSAHHDHWVAGEVVKIGLIMEDLMKYAGLSSLEQYLSLEPTPEDEENLKATHKHIQLLMPRQEKSLPIPIPQKERELRRFTPPPKIVPTAETRKHRHGLKK